MIKSTNLGVVSKCLIYVCMYYALLSLCSLDKALEFPPSSINEARRPTGGLKHFCRCNIISGSDSDPCQYIHKDGKPPRPKIVVFHSLLDLDQDKVKGVVVKICYLLRCTLSTLVWLE